MNRITTSRDLLRESNKEIIISRKLGEPMLEKLNQPEFDLIKNERMSVDGIKTSNQHQVSSGIAINRPKYETIGNSMFRVENSRLNNLNREIVDVDTTRALSEKLSKSRIQRIDEGNLINKDILLYKHLTREKIYEKDDEINNEYIGDERRILQISQPENIQPKTDLLSAIESKYSVNISPQNN